MLCKQQTSEVESLLKPNQTFQHSSSPTTQSAARWLSAITQHQHLCNSNKDSHSQAERERGRELCECSDMQPSEQNSYSSAWVSSQRGGHGRQWQCRRDTWQWCWCELRELELHDSDKTFHCAAITAHVKTHFAGTHPLQYNQIWTCVLNSTKKSVIKSMKKFPSTTSIIQAINIDSQSLGRWYNVKKLRSWYCWKY